MALFSRGFGVALGMAAVLSAACVGPVDTLVGPSKSPTTTPQPSQPTQPQCQFSWSFPKTTNPNGTTQNWLSLQPGTTYRINVSSTCGWRPQTTPTPFGIGITNWGFSGNSGFIDVSAQWGVGVHKFSLYVDSDTTPFPRLASGSVCTVNEYGVCPIGAQ
jgi:hypothetical protein